MCDSSFATILPNTFIFLNWHCRPDKSADHDRRLFSDHYLNYNLPKHWDALRDESSAIMAQLQQLYMKFTPNTSNEAQTEDDWIKPVLHAIGHTFEVQSPLKVPDGVQRPD